MVDLVLKCLGGVAIAMALLGVLPAEQIALMLVVGWLWISQTNALGGAPVY